MTTNTCGLMAVPLDLLYRIADHLDYVSVTSLQLTCPNLHHALGRFPGATPTNKDKKRVLRRLSSWGWVQSDWGICWGCRKYVPPFAQGTSRIPIPVVSCSQQLQQPVVSETMSQRHQASVLLSLISTWAVVYYCQQCQQLQQEKKCTQCKQKNIHLKPSDVAKSYRSLRHWGWTKHLRILAWQRRHQLRFPEGIVGT